VAHYLQQGRSTSAVCSQCMQWRTYNLHGFRFLGGRPRPGLSHGYHGRNGELCRNKDPCRPGKLCRHIILEDIQEAPVPKRCHDPLRCAHVRFLRRKSSTRRYIDLHTRFDEKNLIKTIPICYMVIDVHTSYNMLLGVVVSTPQFAIKFPSTFGDIITIHGDQKTVRECYIASLKLPTPLLITKNVERDWADNVMIKGEDLDPRVNKDTL